MTFIWIWFGLGVLGVLGRAYMEPIIAENQWVATETYGVARAGGWFPQTKSWPKCLWGWFFGTPILLVGLVPWAVRELSIVHQVRRKQHAEELKAQQAREEKERKRYLKEAEAETERLLGK